MSDGMRRELAYLSSHATNRYFIPNWGNLCLCFRKSGISVLLVAFGAVVRFAEHLAVVD